MNTTPRCVNPFMHLAAVVRQPRPPEVSLLYVDGPLHAAQGAELGNQVQARLRRGERTIVLSLARVSRLDAAGIGELVRAYNVTVAAAGALSITHVPARVREILDRVGLFDVLAAV